MRKRNELTSSLDPCVSIAGSHDLVGKVLEVLLGGGVFESATDETLGREHGVFWVSHCLYI